VRFALALLAASAGVAEAGHSCHEISPVMGYSECRRFASWSSPFGPFTELGAQYLRFDTDSIAAAMRAAGASPTPVRGLVGSWRSGVAISWFYVGDELALGGLGGGPTSSGSALAPFAVAPPTDTSGFIVQDLVFAGARAIQGPIALGGELGVGFRMSIYSSPVLAAPSYNAFDASFLFAARAKVDVWATTWLTVGAIATVNLVDPKDVGLGIVVGFHVQPYDGTR